MKNKEKYKELLETYALAGVDWGTDGNDIKPCHDFENCHGCDFLVDDRCCDIIRVEWLEREWCDKEYKEPEVDWSKVPVDTKVTVSDDGINWYNRYFAGVENGKICIWAGGANSWSAKGDGNFKQRWNYISLVEIENE